MKNSDAIRQLSDEELADFIARQRFSAVNPIADKLGIDVTTAFIVGRKNALDWLKQEVRRAAWQSWEQDKPPCKWYSCDYCGFHALSRSNYCPNCGADMREV